MGCDLAGEEARLMRVIIRRELRDTLRDWRIAMPIALLTLVFPVLMAGVAQLGVYVLSRYNAFVLAERVIPFLMLVVSFLPLSFSLVIALETFVGERERNCLEPLLAAPISDRALYLGKLLAAVIPPLLAVYTSIGLYVLTVRLVGRLEMPPALYGQAVALTTLEACVMVVGAVVVSAHTTSVRAANLLASFIIVPMALVIQAESIALLWGREGALWWFALALGVLAVILLRAGLRLFQREHLLARGRQDLSPKRLWQMLKEYWRAPAYAGGEPFSLRRVYLRDVPAVLKESRRALVCVGTSVVLAALLGRCLAQQYPLPVQLLNLPALSASTFQKISMPQGLPPFTVSGIFWNNVRSLLVETCVGALSLGTGALLLLMVPMMLIGYFAGTVELAGGDVLRFVLAFIAPHGVVELPAAFVATALALRVGLALVTPHRDGSVSRQMLEASVDFVKIFIFLVVPLLLIAAVVETQITPRVIMMMYR
ncbi:MAG: stage II sporulation protein M [Anaerolineae bacterium]